MRASLSRVCSSWRISGERWARSTSAEVAMICSTAPSVASAAGDLRGAAAGILIRSGGDGAGRSRGSGAERVGFAEHLVERIGLRIDQNLLAGQGAGVRDLEHPIPLGPHVVEHLLPDAVLGGEVVERGERRPGDRPLRELVLLVLDMIDGNRAHRTIAGRSGPCTSRLRR